MIFPVRVRLRPARLLAPLALLLALPFGSLAQPRTAEPAVPGKRPAPEQPAGAPSKGQLSTPQPGSKNYSATPAPDVVVGDSDRGAAITSGGAGWRFNACGSLQDGGWTTTSPTFETIRSCTLSFTEPGFVYLAGSASIGIKDANYEARFNLNIDSPSGNAATDRWINAYTDSGDGTDKSVHVSWLAPVSAGQHTFYFLGARYSGTGTVQLYDPSFSVLYVPSSATDVKACGVAANTVWNTSETSFQEIRSCTLNVPESGFVYMVGSSSAGLASGGQPYEGRFRLGVDAVTGTASSDRWINVYTDSGDGTDEAVVTSLLTSVAAGPHTFYFSGTRYNGTGPLQLYDPSLSVLYFPAPNVTAKVCGASGSDTYTNATTSYSIIRSCTLNVPRSGFAFIDASASAGLNATGAGNEYEAQFRVGVDNDTGTSLSDRWVNVDGDASDGTDRALSESVLLNISEGIHTFYFVGRRYAGNGTVRLYSPSLTVIVPGDTGMLPLIIK